MSESFAHLPIACSWMDRTYWRMIGYVPSAQTGLALLADNEDDRAVGRKLMDKLGPKPCAMPDEEFRDAVLLWPLSPTHWVPSRFSDGGHYGLLYAAFERETALAEAMHYYRRFFADAGIPLAQAPVQQRGLFTFKATELLADARKAAKRQRHLVADDHAWCRNFGRYLAAHLQSGWVYRSARCQGGSAIALLRASHANTVEWVETVRLGEGIPKDESH